MKVEEIQKTSKAKCWSKMVCTWGFLVLYRHVWKFPWKLWHYFPFLCNHLLKNSHTKLLSIHYNPKNFYIYLSSYSPRSKLFIITSEGFLSSLLRHWLLSTQRQPVSWLPLPQLSFSDFNLHRSGIRHHKLFCVYLLLLDRMFLRFIHVVINIFAWASFPNFSWVSMTWNY